MDCVRWGAPRGTPPLAPPVRPTRHYSAGRRFSPRSARHHLSASAVSVGPPQNQGPERRRVLPPFGPRLAPFAPHPFSANRHVGPYRIKGCDPGLARTRASTGSNDPWGRTSDCGYCFRRSLRRFAFPTAGESGVDVCAEVVDADAVYES